MKTLNTAASLSYWDGKRTVVRREPVLTDSSLSVEWTIEEPGSESLKAESGCLPKMRLSGASTCNPMDGTYPHGRGSAVVLFGAPMAQVPVRWLHRPLCRALCSLMPCVGWPHSLSCCFIRQKLSTSAT